MRKIGRTFGIGVFAFLFLTAVGLFAQSAQTDTGIQWTTKPQSGELIVTATLEPNCLLPVQWVAFSGGEPVRSPDSVTVSHPQMERPLAVYRGPGEYQWVFPLTTLRYLNVSWGEILAERTPDPKYMRVYENQKMLYRSPDLQEVRINSGYQVVKTEAGYMPPSDFLKFLEVQEQAQPEEKKNLFENRGLWMTILLALLGGLALNLTPCVLPLIPVNLAIIGADPAGKGKAWDRILRALIYSAGIALTYGALGIAAVLTGYTFGTLDSTWYFNAAVAVIFLLLGLAMFDVFQLDFARFGNRMKLPSGAHYGGVLILGIVSALLAGACVAPVLVAALLQASRMYADGNYAGLFLPFLLGVGMALPWPFLAAGLALFPKPGAWMVHVKRLLGLMILILAAYYAYQSVKILTAVPAKTAAVQRAGAETVPTAAGGDASRLNRAIRESSQTGKPILLYFTADWCKNCMMMDQFTFRDPKVVETMKGFLFVKIDASDSGNPLTQELISHFKVMGFPSFLILRGTPASSGDPVPAPE